MNHMSNEAYLDAESKNVAARGLRLTPSEICKQICCVFRYRIQSGFLHSKGSLPEQMY